MFVTPILTFHLTLVLQSLEAPDVGPKGLRLTQYNLIQNLRDASSEAEASMVLKYTKYRVGQTGVPQIDIKKLSPRLLETISPASASYVLGKYYLVNKETINLLYESTEFWAWKAYAPLVLYLTLWGGTIVAGTTNGPIGFIKTGFLLGIPLTIFGLFSDLIRPSVVISDRTFAETGVEIAPQHLRAIKALVLACSR